MRSLASAPKVSAVVSTYNAERFIVRCIENLLEQTNVDLEIIVVDSGSEQGEGQLLEPYLASCQNITYIRTERETLYAAWNRAIALARGEYLMNANTDDLSFPSACKLMADALDQNPELALVYSDYYLTNSETDSVDSETKGEWRLISAPKYSHKELLIRCYCGPRPMWRRLVHQRLGMFDEQLRYAGDYEFWLRIAEAFPMLGINVPLHLYFDNAKGLWRSLSHTDEETAVRRKYLQMGQ